MDVISTPRLMSTIVRMFTATRHLRCWTLPNLSCSSQAASRRRRILGPKNVQAVQHWSSGPSCTTTSLTLAVATFWPRYILRTLVSSTKSILPIPGVIMFLDSNSPKPSWSKWKRWKPSTKSVEFAAIVDHPTRHPAKTATARVAANMALKPTRGIVFRRSAATKLKIRCGTNCSLCIRVVQTYVWPMGLVHRNRRVSTWIPFRTRPSFCAAQRYDGRPAVFEGRFFLSLSQLSFTRDLNLFGRNPFGMRAIYEEVRTGGPCLEGEIGQHINFLELLAARKTL